MHTLLLIASLSIADVGDPQIRTDHPWYPGELACSTFDRLFATQAAVYERVTGIKPTTDEHKALAAWLWRNTHYAHAEEGCEDFWGKGFIKGGDMRNREYWTGLFAHGFGLCGTTHSQWCAEMEALLGHGRGRGVGVAGHNTFEVFLTGGEYGQGKWVLLDHDLSTVIYDAKGKGLLSMAEVAKDWKKLSDRKYLPARQPWLVCGLHPGDGGSYASYKVAEYFAGYSGPPPIVHLRKGETLRRYFRPGLEDGKTFVFWGRNYNIGGVPGPERSHSWVNQPDEMYKSKKGAGYKPGQARFANAVYTYKPDFASAAYKEGVVAESDGEVTFEFTSPYIIAASPASTKPWGIYETGCKGGLFVSGKTACSVSVDRGKSWHRFDAADGIDMTDVAKGHRQYLLKFHAGAKDLAKAGLTITTVCQANAAIMPRLKDQGTAVHFEASGRAVVSAGPNVAQAQGHIVAGKFASPKVTLELATPRGESVATIHAAAHVNSSAPPRADVKYQIEYSTDAGKTWKPIVKDWTINRKGEEPPDFWSQSLCWGSIEVPEKNATKVQVRFQNSGGKNYARAEVHLVYRIKTPDATKVTYAWTDDAGPHRESHEFNGAKGDWRIPTGKNTQTQWVEFGVVGK